MAKTQPNQLSLKQQRFVAAYIADPAANGKRAAIQAGYSTKRAADAACRLLKNHMVAAAIEGARSEIMEHGKYSAEVAMADLRRAEQFALRTGNATALMRCHELMMRLHGLLIDKAQVQIERVDIGGTLIEARKRVIFPPHGAAEYEEIPNPFA